MGGGKGGSFWGPGFAPRLCTPSLLEQSCNPSCAMPRKRALCVFFGGGLVFLVTPGLLGLLQPPEETFPSVPSRHRLLPGALCSAKAIETGLGRRAKLAGDKDQALLFALSSRGPKAGWAQLWGQSARVSLLSSPMVSRVPKWIASALRAPALLNLTAAQSSWLLQPTSCHTSTRSCCLDTGVFTCICHLPECLCFWCAHPQPIPAEKTLCWGKFSRDGACRISAAASQLLPPARSQQPPPPNA